MTEPKKEKRKVLQPLLNDDKLNISNNSDNQNPDNVNKCIFCDKLYGTRSNLLKHVRLKHPKHTLSSGRIECKEDKCKFSCRILQQLRHHLQAEHGEKMEAEHLVFDTMAGVFT